MASNINAPIENQNITKHATFTIKYVGICIGLLLVFGFIATLFYCCGRHPSDCGDITSLPVIDTGNVRNIIFVGRSRTGKTTSIEVLKNKDYNPGLLNVISQTKNATLHSFESETGLIFNIMDTPGLFELALDISDKRTNDIILDVIRKCIQHKIEEINHVYFFMTIQQGLHEEDLEAFKLFTYLFVGMDNKMSIVIGRGQHIKNTTFYIDQFKSVPDLKPLYEKGNGRIFFLGAVQQNAMVNIGKMKEKVYAQREKLLQHMTEQSTAYHVKQLKVYSESLQFSLSRYVWQQLMELLDRYVCGQTNCSNKALKKKNEL